MFNIKEIAITLNTLSMDYKIGNLQDLRKKLKGLDRRPGTDLFREETISRDNEWAFHFGGRKELQFNIGTEKEGLRFGIAFSLEPSQTLPDISLLYPKIYKFNQYIREKPSFLHEYKMWYWQKSNRSSIFNVSEINEDLIQNNNFIFIGKISEALDYDQILSTFDHLLELYIYVESSDKIDSSDSSDDTSTFTFTPSKRQLVAKRNYSTVQRQISVDVRHSILQEKLYNNLASQYGVENIAIEHMINGKPVDLILRNDSEFWFFEVKTNRTAKECIRAAFGQLFEYAYWPGKINANRLIVAGEKPLDQSSMGYLDFLKNKFGIPIEYTQVNIENIDCT